MRHKSLLLGSLFLVILRAAAQGPASFALQNLNRPAGVDAPVFDAEGSLLWGPSYRAELYGGQTSNVLAPLIELDTGTRVMVPLLAPGYFYSTSGFLSVPEAAPGGWAWLQMRAWDARVGGTYEEAVGRGLGGYGESLLFYARGGDPLALPPTLPGPLIGLQSFSLREVIPEPSTWALLVAGAIALWWASRRQRPREQ